jgi:hypothetical protein
MLNFQDFLTEMAQIKKVGSKVYADDKLLKTMKDEDLGSNMLFFMEKQGNWFMQKGKFYLYFVDSPEWIEKLQKGEYDFLFFPIRTSFNMFNVAPITDVWKKKFQKNTRGAEHVLGIVEGFADEEKKKVYIEMMSVRPAFKRNKINTMMLDALKGPFHDYEWYFEDVTDDGYMFAKKWMPDVNFSWTGSYRSKEWKKDHPDGK